MTDMHNTGSLLPPPPGVDPEPAPEGRFFTARQKVIGVVAALAILFVVLYAGVFAPATRTSYTNSGQSVTSTSTLNTNSQVHSQSYKDGYAEGQSFYNHEGFPGVDEAVGCATVWNNQGISAGDNETQYIAGCDAGFGS